MKKKKNFSEADQQKENLLLDERLKRPETARTVTVPDQLKRSRPELGHDPYSITPIAGVNSENLNTTNSRNKDDMSAANGFFGLRLKSAYHDLLAKDDGFTPFSEIDFPWIEFRYQKDKLKVHQVGAVNITSLFPISRLEKQLSWRLNILFDTDQTLACKDCLLLRGEGGGGFTLGDDNYRLYIMALIRQEFHHRLNNGYRTRPGLEASWIWRPSFTAEQNYKTRLTTAAYTDIDPQPFRSHLYQFNWSHSYVLKRNTELRLSTILSYTDVISKPDVSEMKLEWLNYFD